MDAHSFVDARESAPTLAQPCTPPHLLRQRPSLTVLLIFVTGHTMAGNSNPQIAYAFQVRYILGFDGGGTKTECVLMNSADQVLARTFAGPSNPSRIGVEAAVHAVEESADLALRDAGLERSVISAVGAGLAGTAKAEMRERVSCALQECFPGAAITVLTDLDAALAAAGEGPAIILVAGTGSAAFGRNADGEIVRSGGYSPSSSDQGSAYDIGRRAIAV